MILCYLYGQIVIGADGEERWLYGRYSCIAKNIYGYVTDSATLTEAGECLCRCR